MTVTKKQITYGVLALAIIGLIVVVGAFALRSSTKPTTQTSTTTAISNVPATEKDATASIAKAKEARSKGDFTAAIASYQQARAYYTAQNNVEKTADIDIAISLLESEKRHAVTPPKPVLAGEK